VSKSIAELPSIRRPVGLCNDERDPDDRYPTAAAIKADLVAPERVQVTGRADRLKTPPLGSRYWRVARIVVIALVVPVLLFLCPC
jgi:hypothetical protein